MKPTTITPPQPEVPPVAQAGVVPQQVSTPPAQPQPPVRKVTPPLEVVPIKPSEKELLVIEATRKEIIRALSIFLLVAVVFILLRFILELVGADPSSIFVALIYLISGIFMFPFYGIFTPTQSVALVGESVFNGTALIALFCYVVLIPLAMIIISIVAKMFKTEQQKK